MQHSRPDKDDIEDRGGTVIEADSGLNIEGFAGMSTESV